MNLKRIFGALLTLLGIGGLIYVAVSCATVKGGNINVVSMIIFGAFGLLFFISGISLIRTTKDGI